MDTRTATSLLPRFAAACGAGFSGRSGNGGRDGTLGGALLRRHRHDQIAGGIGDRALARMEQRRRAHLLDDGRAYALVGQTDIGYLWGIANDVAWQLDAI